MSLTKREQFAAMAMQGMLANKGLLDQWLDRKAKIGLALEAIEHAECLIAALEHRDAQP